MQSSKLVIFFDEIYLVILGMLTYVNPYSVQYVLRTSETVVVPSESGLSHGTLFLPATRNNFASIISAPNTVIGASPSSSATPSSPKYFQCIVFLQNCLAVVLSRK